MVEFVHIFNLKGSLGKEESMMSTPEVNINATALVIRGYDLVAYFTEGRPVPGRPDLEMKNKGGNFFASTANRDAFKTEPEKYLSQYGGHCAFGVALGKKFEGN